MRNMVTTSNWFQTIIIVFVISFWVLIFLIAKYGNTEFVRKLSDRLYRKSYNKKRMPINCMRLIDRRMNLIKYTKSPAVICNSIRIIEDNINVLSKNKNIKTEQRKKYVSELPITLAETVNQRIMDLVAYYSEEFEEKRITKKRYERTLSELENQLKDYVLNYDMTKESISNKKDIVLAMRT